MSKLNRFTGTWAWLGEDDPLGPWGAEKMLALTARAGAFISLCCLIIGAAAAFTSETISYSNWAAIVAFFSFGISPVYFFWRRLNSAPNEEQVEFFRQLQRRAGFNGPPAIATRLDLAREIRAIEDQHAKRLLGDK